MISSSDVLKFIKEEVREQDYKMDEHHIDTIANSVFEQLSEYMKLEDMDLFLKSLRGEFEELVDNLIPVIEEYEEKINQIIDTHIGMYNTEKKVE